MHRDIWDSYWSDSDNWDWWKRPAPGVLELIESLSPTERPRVLDLGCGLGRHAIAFALAGFAVTAVDTSCRATDHLNGWARELGLSIDTRVCDVLGESLERESYNVVLAYNVIYHGLRDDLARAIGRVYQLLKYGGLFFFTCPSREDGKYGFGRKVAPHTFECEKSVTPGDIHYFADETDLDTLLAGFRIVRRWKAEGWWDNKGERQFFSNWHVLAERR